MYTPKGSKAKSDGVQVARAIAAGDVSTARNLVSLYRRSWRTVPEARAIIGACRYANEAYGVYLNHYDFLYK